MALKNKFSFIHLFNHFWFQSANAKDVAFLRVGFYFLAFLVVGFLSPPVLLSDTLFLQPSFFFTVFKLPMLSSDQSEVFLNLIRLDLLFLFLTAIGFLTSLSAFASFGISFYLYGIEKNYGQFHHFDSILVLSLFITAFAPLGDEMSVDRWIKKYCPLWPVFSGVRFFGAYFWPKRLLQCFWIFIFFSAGVLKLFNNPDFWVDNNAVQIVLLRESNLIHGRMFANGIGFLFPISDYLKDILLSHPTLAQVTSWLVLILELSMPLAFFSKLKGVFISISVLMLLFVLLLLGHPFFFSMLPLMWSWVDQKVCFQVVAKKTV